MQDIKKRLDKIKSSIDNKNKPIIVWIDKVKENWLIKEQYLNKQQTIFKTFYLSDYASYLNNISKDTNVIIDDI